MPLTKRAVQEIQTPQSGQLGGVQTPPIPAESLPPMPENDKKASMPRQKEMTKDDYWRRREERDAQRDKDMAWSGLAQAVLQSVAAAQMNIENTEDGLVALVARITDKLLKVRDNR